MKGGHLCPLIEIVRTLQRYGRNIEKCKWGIKKPD
jgi:hypothetical protein